MTRNLLIVESPAKAKTIEKILGKDYKVASSFGHIRDLPKKNMGIDIANAFTPQYEITPDKKKVVKSLKEEMKRVETVWLATDEDREGEAIAWHLCAVLGLDVQKTKRIAFREITKDAVLKSIEHPRRVDMNLVNAQQARRILDRVVGFELSELLWRKIKGKLSAGRVQSVAVKLIVEREREIREFESVAAFKVYGHFSVDQDVSKNNLIKAELSQSFPTEKEAQAFLEKVIGSNYKISDLRVKPVKRNPTPPFTTSTLQQEASRKYGFSVSRTMSAAQKLYESGAITYMRTDSTMLSQQALNTIHKAIVQNYGERYAHKRQYKTQRANAQEAHEAIRPTYIDRMEAGEDNDQRKLYDLIWKRTIASQMSSAELERTEVDIDISNHKEGIFMASGEVMKFDGFLKVYMETLDDDLNENGQSVIPPVKVGQILFGHSINAIQKYSKPKPRYTEATLVKQLEALGIGRPSTYAPTITRIMEKERGYIVKDKIEGVNREFVELTLKNGKIKKEVKSEVVGGAVNRLHPTDLGIIVTDFLEEHFSTIMDYSFTADVEGKLDEIAEEGINWSEMIGDFYSVFHKDVENTIENTERVRARRELGVDPVTGHTVLVQLTRFGPVVQIGTKEEMPEGSKPRFANLQPDQKMELITFDEAMELFKLPKDLGKFEGEEITINSGRFGPYVKFKELFISIPRGEDPLKVDFDRAVELISLKLDENKPLGKYKDLDITKGKGRFGPFIKWNGIFVNVPKKIDLDHISLKEAIQLIDAKVDKEANRFIQNWEKEGIAIENGRWGPFIRFKKNAVKIPKAKGESVPAEELKQWSLDQVKAIIEEALPGSFKANGKK
jgi:DNA topoisomerase I